MGERSHGEVLTEWKRQHRLSDREAAEWCELSVSAFRRQRRGQVKRTPRQTLKLATLYPIYNLPWLDVAEAALKVGRTITPSRKTA